jgi:ribosome-binding factor A
MTSKHFGRGRERLRSRREPTADELFDPSFQDCHDYKTLQLCAQAARALTGALETELRDPVFSVLTLVEVKPYPNASHLLAVFAARPGTDLRAAEESLSAASKILRHELTRAVFRKRLPMLSFLVVPEEACHE